MIKTIVVPVDGSEHARKAAILAGDIGEKYGAEIVLVTVALRPGHIPPALRKMAEVEHLIDPERGAAPQRHGLPGDTAAAVGDAREVDLDEAAATRIAEWVLEETAQAVKDQGIDAVRKRLEFGEPVETILAVAREEKANLLVMGSRGLSALGGLLMGSVSHKLCQLADCSCITVK